MGFLRLREADLGVIGEVTAQGRRTTPRGTDEKEVWKTLRLGHADLS